MMVVGSIPMGGSILLRYSDETSTLVFHDGRGFDSQDLDFPFLKISLYVGEIFYSLLKKEYILSIKIFFNIFDIPQGF